MTAAVPVRTVLRILIPFALGYYLSYLYRTVNAVIAPELTRDLQLGAADLGLLTSAYFLSFGLFQIPLGILLDRYGPRRVEATLLLFAAAGAGLFALGSSLAGLGVARALIGLGVSACLMASFKAFHQWFPPERQPSLVGFIMVSGTLGALTATTPVEALLPLTGWRGLFFVLAGLSVLAAAAILTVPEQRGGVPSDSLAQQMRGVRAVFGDREFWRYGLQLAMLGGGFMALQGLWAVPWLMSTEGLSRAFAAQHLFALNLTLLAGYAVIAAFSLQLARLGATPLRLLIAGSALQVAVGAAILLGAAPGILLWPALGLAACVGNLAYPLVTARFPGSMAGRVNTALNLLIFAGAFGVQWGFGALVDLARARGADAAAAFRLAFGILLALQLASHAWFLLGRPTRPAAPA
jgi:MFS family permease